MRVLLSTIGSRGDVQPILALAVELRVLGHDATLCVPPNFKEWVESFGLGCVPIGPDVKKLTGGTTPAPPPKPSKERRRQLAAYTIREQFQVLTEAARGCDLIVGFAALQLAAPSIAEAFKIPYVFATYCPVTLPSPDHPPPRMDTHYPLWFPGAVNRLLWMRDGRRWNDLFGATLNEERAKCDLPPVASVQSYVFTDRPWLAADARLAPAASAARGRIVQTGAWFLPDRSALTDALENFLADGEPPIYFSFGSMRATDGTSRVLVDAARAVGRRSIISQGWGDLGAADDSSDCFAIGETNYELLLPRVAAAVHHGGAGTTTAAARAGKPQVVVPHVYDQYYWAHRVAMLGIGVSGPTRDRLAVANLAAALRDCLQPEPTTRARALASQIDVNGARIAAERMIREFG